MQQRNYYYFVATLPSLTYGEKPPISYDAFLQDCNEQLHPSDAKFLRYCRYDPRMALETRNTGSAFIDLLMHRERVMVLNLAFGRAAKLHRIFPSDPPHDVPRTEAMARTALDMEDPLEGTIMIDENRWAILDNAVGLNCFGVNNVFAQLLKLQLMERRQAFRDADKGAAEYRNLYDTILNEYNSKVERG